MLTPEQRDKTVPICAVAGTIGIRGTRVSFSDIEDDHIRVRCIAPPHPLHITVNEALMHS